jgi:Fe-S-cluster containining protein
MWIKQFKNLILLPFWLNLPYFWQIQAKIDHIETNLLTISSLSIAREHENERFKMFLQQVDSGQIDSKVLELNNTITPKIDCTRCGNCCKSLMITVSDEEANVLSSALNQTRENFDEQYLEKGSNGLMLINTIPCTFLSDNKCTIYENRFAGCREFPAMHLPNFKQRLFTSFMHYNRCPIIFNVIEELKDALLFERD